MKLKTLPTESAVALLGHLADHPALSRLLEGLESAISLNELKRLLCEIAAQLKAEAQAGSPETVSGMSLKNDPLLSERTKELLSCLSPKEEKKLLSKFGLLES